MSLRLRLVLLLACVVAAFGLAAAGLRLAHHAEGRRMLAELQQERSDLLDRLLALTGQSLQSFANDYSLWDEMVAFVRSGDPTWATINIDPSLANFDAQGAWVLQPDGRRLHASVSDPAPEPTPFADAGFLAQLRREKSLHFFQDGPGGLIEFRTGPILPSDDLKREREPRGWFIVARRWDEPHLHRLGDTLQSRVTLAPAGPAAPAAAPTLVHLERPLRDWSGRPVRTLQVEYDSPLLAQLLRSNREETYLLYGFGLAMIAVLTITLSVTVLRPVQQLARSLEANDPAPIRALQHGADEFGDLARQVAQSFVQREALRDSEEQLRQWMALHERLGRDLHDGIIQSVYAAGLGLESARNLLHTDPAAAEQRLASCQRMFNDTLWQVRSFIQALEPEQPRGQSPAQSLSALVSTMQSLQVTPIAAAIDRDLAARIRPAQELHLLHIARELLSNALRHAGASQIRISLQPQAGGLACLQVSDDGAGFEPAAGGHPGRGLANLSARARELDARLEIDSAPGKGTRIAVWFRPS
jgi:signal transduction histidine kinase